MIETAERYMMDGSTAFEIAATEVLGALRTSVANILSAVGGVRKPSDLQKSFKLDWTLSWQIFQVAGPMGNEASTLAAGAKVPSRSSLKRFLDAAESRGVESAKVERVWSSFDRFENLVEVHAGDRTSFNSMVSAAAGIDAEWLATDVQHRRNAYRAMSHIVGMQAMAKHICGIYDEAADGTAWNLGLVVGYVGLRMLRAIPNALVFRMRMMDPHVRQRVSRAGLGAPGGAAGGYLLSDYSTNPLPTLNTRELDAGWLITELEKPAVGNLGAATLRFGTAYYGHPVPGAVGVDESAFDGDVVVDKPVEVLVSDALVRPGLMRGATPTAQVLLGNSHGDNPSLPGDLIPVLGDHRVEYLGKCPEVLATPDVPDYADLMRAAAAKLGCNIDGFEAWRIRMEHPVYQSTVRMTWKLPRISR